jgi:hypothetical protein
VSALLTRNGRTRRSLLCHSRYTKVKRSQQKQYSAFRAFHVLLLWLILAVFTDGTAQAAPQTFLSFHCGDGTEFVASVYEAGRRAQVQLEGKPLTLRSNAKKVQFSL